MFRRFVCRAKGKIKIKAHEEKSIYGDACMGKDI